jgi:hypothetical protein
MPALKGVWTDVVTHVEPALKRAWIEITGVWQQPLLNRALSNFSQAFKK